MCGGIGQPVPQQLFEVREAIGAPQSGFVPIEDQPGGKRQGLGDDGEVHALDAAAKREKPEEGGKEHRHEDGAQEAPEKALERIPEERQFLHLGPDHEIGELAPIDALGPDLQGQVHPHAIGAEAEEHPLPHTEHAAIAPDQIQAQGQNGKGQKLAELIEAKITEMQPGVLGRQEVQQRNDHEEQEAHDIEREGFAAVLVRGQLFRHRRCVLSRQRGPAAATAGRESRRPE